MMSHTKLQKKKLLVILGIVVIIIPWIIFEAWGWMVLSRDTYINSKTTCKEFSDGVHQSFIDDDEDKMNSMMRKLTVSMGVELSSNKSMMRESYANDQKVTAFIDSLIIKQCNLNPKRKLAAVIKEVAKTAQMP
jgi:hypothetical protein